MRPLFKTVSGGDTDESQCVNAEKKILKKNILFFKNFSSESMKAEVVCCNGAEML